MVPIISIINSGSGAYLIDNIRNGDIALIRGNTYNLEILANGHPFWIQTVLGKYSSNNIYSAGVTGNGTENGTIIFVVPMDAPNTLYYACQYHSSMQGRINITDPLSTTLPLPTITNFRIPVQTYSNGGTFTITAPSSNSTGAFSYTSSNTNIATVSGSIVSILQAGTITITATQAVTNDYNSASVSTTLTITLPIKPTRMLMRSLYTNNAQVFYKSHSLVPGGIGSVRNYRVKSRKT